MVVCADGQGRPLLRMPARTRSLVSGLADLAPVKIRTRQRRRDRSGRVCVRHVREVTLLAAQGSLACTAVPTGAEPKGMTAPPATSAAAPPSPTPRSRAPPPAASPTPTTTFTIDRGPRQPRRLVKPTGTRGWLVVIDEFGDLGPSELWMQRRRKASSEDGEQNEPEDCFGRGLAATSR